MKTNIKSLICTSAAALAVASSALAVPLNTDAIRWSTDGVTWQPVILDNGPGDANPGNNHITTVIIAPGLTLNITSSGNFVGPASHPDIDMGLQGSIGAGETVYIEYSDVGYTPQPTGGSFHTHFFASQGNDSSATEYTAIGSGAGSNSLFDGADFADLASLTAIGPITGNNSGDTYLPAGTADPYSITLVQVIKGNRNGGVVSTDAHLTVPDGGNTLMLLGSALSVLGFGAFRKSRKA